MSLAFVDRPPSSVEVEKLRLILSTFQDGTGQLIGKTTPTLPGWRDFERSVALAFGGIAQESKYVFDVLLADPEQQGIYYGLSCKMRGTLDQTNRTGRVTIELSNSAGMFWGELAKVGLNQRNYRHQPRKVGQVLLATVERWHREASTQGRTVNIAKSFYLTLSWSKSGWYQLHQFPLQLPKYQQLRWGFPLTTGKGRSQHGRRLTGYDAATKGNVFEWYGESGGQLKYYPTASVAVWRSEQFQLEPLPGSTDEDYGILSKAKQYFPNIWKQVSR